MAQGHDHRHRNRRRLAATLVLVLLTMGAEVVGGILSGSLALLADAAHMLSDAGALGLALFALWVADVRPPDTAKTYGYYRAEILAALVNAATLVVIAFFVVSEAWERFQDPPEIRGGLMLGIAALGLVVNLAGVAILHGGRHESLNLRGAWLHVVADTLGSLQALAAAGLIMAFGWTWADPVASVLIALLVIWSGWALLKEAVSVLMEGTPGHIDVEEVRSGILGLAGVAGVHDLHVWSITTGLECLSAHVAVEEGIQRDRVLASIRETLQREHGIDHITIQIEPVAFEECHECPGA